MARELSGNNMRLVVTGDGSNDPSSVGVEYRVLNADGVNDDLLEDPKTEAIDSPNFNQTATLVCTGAASTVKTSEGIS